MDEQEKWLAKHAIECQAYAARISREACAAYQAGHYVDNLFVKPSACALCPNAQEIDAAEAPKRNSRRTAPILPKAAVKKQAIKATSSEPRPPRAPRKRRPAESVRQEKAAAGPLADLERELKRLASLGHLASAELLQRIS